jgi:hypothetical protein
MEFVLALKGTTVRITTTNFRGLSQLSDEFRFRDLAAQLSEFGDSHALKANTLTLTLDTKGNVFGGFTPVEWESPKKGWFRNQAPFSKSDPTLSSFLVS